MRARMDMRRAFRRIPAAVHAPDFAHHASGVARLNNGSFGASPCQVLADEAQHRAWWRANPDAAYFAAGADSLDSRLLAAADAAAAALSAPLNSVALVENATVATAIVANRWSKLLRQRAAGGSVMLLDVCYKAVAYSMRQFCEPAGGTIKFAHVPFPDTTSDSVLRSFEAALLATKPRFVLLDHVSSQPAIVLPVREMVALSRAHGVEEVAIDGAHGVGLLEPSALNVCDIGADWYFTNLHKWAFAPGPVAALHGVEAVRSTTAHVVPSWHVGSGDLLRESRWPGTRDTASALAVPAALQYLASWRSIDDMHVQRYNADGWQQAARMLEQAWGVAPAVSDPSLACTGMGMVRLPPALDLTADAPGQPSAGVRSTLRDRYGIEAAVGGFGEYGGFLRLSHSVYTTDSDLERLRDAVAELARSSF